MGFREILAAERKARGLSQEELAAGLSVSRQAVSKWETGESMPDLRNLLALADTFSLSLDALCGREAPACPAAAPSTQEKKRVFLPVLCGVLLALLVLTGIWGWTRGADPETAGEFLQTEFTVSGVAFYGVSNTQVHYQFVPGISGPDYTYQITFSNAQGDRYPFDAPCVDGVCSGTATLYGWEGYTVTVVVTDGTVSRHLAVANGLDFSEGRASWNNLTD